MSELQFVVPTVPFTRDAVNTFSRIKYVVNNEN
jgi:hypothetical protein